MSDFYGYVDVDEDVTQYSDDGLRKALAWITAEVRAWDDDCPLVLFRIKADIAAEMRRRGLGE